MGCFGNPIVVSGSILCNILYCIVELFSLIRGCRHGWPNHVKTSCTVCVIVLSLCSWTNIVGIKASAGTTVTKVNNKVVFQTHLRSLGPRFEISQFISDISSIFRELTHVDMIISTKILNGIFFNYFLKISLIYPYLKKIHLNHGQPLGQICPQLY